MDSDIKPLDQLSINEFYDDRDQVSNLKRGTDHDVFDMGRMGKKQVLRRDFSFISIVGFVCILQSSWESALLGWDVLPPVGDFEDADFRKANQYGLYNGGTGGVIWTTIAVWLCVMAMIASMAEMASMAPTAGGQPPRVSEFAPPSLEKPLSYVVGWCCCLGWLSGVPACGQFLAYMVEGLIYLIYPDSTFGSNWQTTLLIWAFLAITFTFNIFLSHKLPLAEGIVLVVHVFGFFAFLITLWVVSDHASASQVFLTFQNSGGWSSTGVSCLVGLGTPLWMFIGPDAGAHMSEELKDASLNLPRAMVYATFFNGILAIAMLITFCFCLPNNDALNDILNTETGIPIIQLLYNVTGSNAGTIVLTTLLLVLTYFSTITTIASASRQSWAFARDRGFPFSDWLSIVRPGMDIPLNAILMVLGVSVILSAINFGSDVALNAIISVSNAALIFSYMISIGCLRLKRLRGQPLLPRRWDLGRWGGPINDISLAFLAVSFVFSFFPEDAVTNAPDMNWAIVMFIGVCGLAFVYYIAGGRRKYVNPVSLVKTE